MRKVRQARSRTRSLSAAHELLLLRSKSVTSPLVDVVLPVVEETNAVRNDVSQMLDEMMVGINDLADQINERNRSGSNLTDLSNMDFLEAYFPSTIPVNYKANYASQRSIDPEQQRKSKKVQAEKIKRSADAWTDDGKIKRGKGGKSKFKLDEDFARRNYPHLFSDEAQDAYGKQYTLNEDFARQNYPHLFFEDTLEKETSRTRRSRQFTGMSNFGRFFSHGAFNIANTIDEGNADEFISNSPLLWALKNIGDVTRKSAIWLNDRSSTLKSVRAGNVRRNARESGARPRRKDRRSAMADDFDLFAERQQENQAEENRREVETEKPEQDKKERNRLKEVLKEALNEWMKENPDLFKCDGKSAINFNETPFLAAAGFAASQARNIGIGAINLARRGAGAVGRLGASGLLKGAGVIGAGVAGLSAYKKYKEGDYVGGGLDAFSAGMTATAAFAPMTAPVTLPLALGASALSHVRDGMGYEITTGKSVTPKQRKALEFFMKKGYSKEVAIGIVANLVVESGENLNERAEGDLDKATGIKKAYGIGQWHPDRQKRFQEKFGKSIKGSSFEEQLEFLHFELQNQEKGALKSILKKSSTSEEAAASFDQFYERSSGEHRQRRMSIAKGIESNIKSIQKTIDVDDIIGTNKSENSSKPSSQLPIPPVIINQAPQNSSSVSGKAASNASVAPTRNKTSSLETAQMADARRMF